MSQLPEPRHGLFPAGPSRKLAKQLGRLDAQALAVQHHDSLRVGRVEQAAAHGLIAVAQISGLEASLTHMAPHAAGRLRAVADAGTIGIVGIVAGTGR
ncbi:MAG TPA: hypothetical protein VMB05_08290 [Solirubrobacteraceae bacterium]|nr:hypothetical protein [Solirubrobacteraceae bacterium]